MDGNILKQAIQMMDDAGITQRGLDADGNKYYPSVVIDGHISRITETFLTAIDLRADLEMRHFFSQI